MIMIKKILKKDIYLQKKKRKLLMISYQHNSIIMEYQKIINLLDNTPIQPTKFRTNNWVEINNDARRTYNTNSEIKF